MQDTADSFPYEFKPAYHEPHPSSMPGEKFSTQSAHLYPIDETEDFHDPFSDLSLFLSKKIKKEVEKHGSSKQWSHKIQTSLLEGILPEFKIKFPKYRLGISAIKKVWEKVSYYYGKVQSHEEAFQKDGKLNIEFIIKENLRSYPLNSTGHLPAHHIAHQLAIKISECIATLEGTKPRFDLLAKIIWAAQKHLIGNLSAQKAKNIYEDYDNIDKLVVKILLERTAKQSSLSQKALKDEIKQELLELKHLTKENTPETLYQNVACFLSRVLYPTLSIHYLLNTDERKKVRLFIETQIELGKIATSPSPASMRIETTQRILALYPLAASLPTTLTQKDIKDTIYYVYCQTVNQALPPCPKVHSSLVTFIYAEMHFLKRKEEFSNYSVIEKTIMKTLSMAHLLPLWKADYADELEIFIWNTYLEKETFFKEEPLLRKEISGHIIDFPTFSFKTLIYQITESLKKTKKSLVKDTKEEESILWEEIDQKIYLWTVQNDMLCRWIHFDLHLPLLKIVKKCWIEKNYEEKSVCHHQFVDTVLQELLTAHPYLSYDASLLRTRIMILYKYFWYHELTPPETSTIQRFITWHMQDIKSQHSDKSKEDRLSVLENRISKTLPLTPFSRKTFEKMF